MRLLLAWVALLVWAGPAPAHEISMAEMELRQVAPSDFLWQWTAGNRGGEDALRVQWPAGCRDDQGVLRCGSAGLAGTLGIEGVGDRFSAVLVKIHWSDGQSRVHTLTSAQPEVRLYGSADDRRGAFEVARAYGLLGVEHILTGVDHLLFVVALLFLVGFRRQLVWTITAFTAAHSLTLGLSALGWLTLRSPPVEASIALSIVLVARESLHQEPTLSRRWPAVVAFLFGLVHGLGFAGALAQYGLPEHQLLVSLLSFNLGVELGQLFVVALAFAAVKLLAAWPALVRARVPLLYAIGTAAAYWSWERLAAMAG